MKIEDVILLDRIVAHQSISTGGAACGLTATVSSDRLKRLEKDLGCTLLNRTTRSMSLTDEGSRFLAHAQDLIEQYEMTRHSVGRRAEVPTGLLRVAAPALFGKKFLPEAVNAFLDRYPETSLDLNLSDAILDYTAGGIDVAIRIGRLKSSTRIARKLGDNKRVLCASPSYVERRGQPSRPSELSQHDCIIFIGEDNWQFHRRKKHEKVRVSGRLKTNSAEMATRAALDGLGIALRSVWDIVDDLREGRLVQILSNYEVPTDMTIYAIFPPGRFMSPAARAFADLMHETLKASKIV